MGSRARVECYSLAMILLWIGISVYILQVYECKTLMHGASLTTGFDSHTSPCKKELVIFNSHHILPSYIVHYTNKCGDFEYKVSYDMVAF